MPGFRPRFSLLSLLLLMTIVGMAIVNVQLWREVDPLRVEVRRLRQELGYLSVDDKDKIYAIQVPSPTPDAHRYRVYLPTSRNFLIHTRVHSVPGRQPQQTRQDWFTTLGGAGSSTDIDSGEFTIDVDVRPDSQKPDHWNLAYHVAGRGGGTVGTKMPWLNDRRTWSVSGDPRMGEQLEADPDEGLVLFALRQAKLKEFPGGYSTYPPDGREENPGVMVWIAPASASE